ncbi:MAG TPA: MBOAT family protein [Candidatus Hydrogenedentes bacterium]|nr:MBOAT family protein [Candidatus Hydrogenedentota bacterium]
MSYTIDVYRNNELRTQNFIDFALYVTFFPQLIAGPILRSAQFLPQLLTKRTIDAGQVNDGITYILRGLAKKIIFADTLALYVDVVFAAPDDFGAVNIWFALYAYTYQIYFDFSGYSDIAIGLGKLMGFNIPKNFDLPYLARNPSEYWNRWHISLSTWLRDYLYFTLGGSKSSSNLKVYRNLFLTMMLGGIWHGASWGIFIWGAFHGLWLIVHRILFREHKLMEIPDWIARIATFHLLCIGFLFFRSESFGAIPVLLSGLFDHTSKTYAIPIGILVIFILGAISHILGGSKSLQQLWDDMWPEFRGLVYAVVVLGIWIYTKEAQNFIYFQF